MSLLPGPAAALGLILAVAFPPIVIALSHGPLRIPDAHRRYRVAGVAAIGAFVLGIMALMMAGVPLGWPGIVSGLFLLLTSLWAFGVFWSLICWGFTLSLLQALARLGAPADRDAWFGEYAGAGGVRAFTRNRLMVLIALGLAGKRAPDAVTLGGRGRLLGRVAGLLRRYYGMPND